MAKFLSIPKHLLPSTQTSKRLITEFADTSGMVYFGYVSQRSDDHHIVRGFTVSTKHIDDHYCIGTHEGYDIIFVERTDSLRSGKQHTWHILEIDLKTGVDLPHLFIGSSKQTHGFHELIKTKYHTMHPVSLGATAAYSKDFLAEFGVYTTPAHAITTEQLLPPDDTAVIASHFKGLAFEVIEQSLYVYSEKPHITKDLLQAMLTNGLWLAGKIDQNSRLL